MSLRGFLTSLLALLSVSSFAQTSERTDSLVRLMNAKSVQLIQEDARNYRKAISARFLHNDTYLICDTALWDVDEKVIHAVGNVKIMQDETELTSDKMDYFIDEDLAKFRGSLVQLRDKDGNTLRTRYLDYNTKDSSAFFSLGASMKDKDGQIIESVDGVYESKFKLFTFVTNVDMYTDSVFVKTSKLTYQSETTLATFYDGFDAWKGENMLSASKGWYNRGDDIFFFNGSVHGLTPTREMWCDSLYYYQALEDVVMHGNIQLTDTSRNVTAVAEYMFYKDSTATMTMERNAAIAARSELDDGQIDTVYFGADRFVHKDILMCDISPDVLAAAENRLKELEADPVNTYRRKAAEEAAKAAAEAAANDPNNPENAALLAAQYAAQQEEEQEEEPEEDNSKEQIPPDSAQAAADTVSLSDSLAVKDLLALGDSLAVGDSLSVSDSLAVRDSLTVRDSLAVVDSLAIRDSLALGDSLPVKDVPAAKELLEMEPAPEGDAAPDEEENVALPQPEEEVEQKDTTKVGFLSALGHVKVYRSDMQAVCDSLEYCDLDSLARLFVDPIVWNEDDGHHQYRSDSLSIVIRDQKMDRASLMSNAFIIIQEDTLHYDQIKGAEVMAYFDSTTVLKRFDALGGASALFYLQENDAFATVNKVDSKMISAHFQDGTIERIFYFDAPKNDAYPVVQLPKEDRLLKGFNWVPDKRPTGRGDVTQLVIKPTERKSYESRPRPIFHYTNRYFPGHIQAIYDELARVDSLQAVRRAQEQARKEMEEMRMSMDAMAAEDTVGLDEHLASLDSLISPVSAPADSLLIGADSLGTARTIAGDSLALAPSVADSAIVAPTAAELRAKKKAEQEAAMEARRAAKEDRWAALDARDALKQAKKDAKALERKRRQTLKAYLALKKEEAKEQKKLQRLIERYEKKKARRGDAPVADSSEPEINPAPPAEGLQLQDNYSE